MKTYLNLLHQLVTTGERRQDRTGVGTLSLFGRQCRYDLSEGFPLLTTKKIHLRSVIHELLWFIRGETNTQYLTEHKVTIWDEWADPSGDLGPLYGHQWRKWDNHHDQLSQVVEGIKKDPFSRRHIVSAWNVSDLDKMALLPCHVLFQFYVHTDERLSCHLYQRSADYFLGVPFNIASYSLLTLMVAQVVQLKPGSFVHSFGDVHLYTHHIDQAKLQLTRTPHSLPKMTLNPRVTSIFDFKYEDFHLADYHPDPSIQAPIAI